MKDNGDNAQIPPSEHMPSNNEDMQQYILELRAKNEAYVQTINYLSNELLNSRKRHINNKSTCKRGKKQKCCDCACSKKNAFNCLPQDTLEKSHKSSMKKTVAAIPPSRSSFLPSHCDASTMTGSTFNSPLELYFGFFCNLEREDLDNCQLVCKDWHHIIKKNVDKWPRRVIRCVKLIEKTSMTLTISNRRVTKKYAFALNDIQERPETLFDTLKRFLCHSYIKRIIICNLSLTDDFCRRMSNCFKSLNFPEILRVEMLAVNLHHVSPDVFHKFLGQTMVASQYFIDGVRNAAEEHFSSRLFEQAALRNADDFTVYDVRSLDNEDVVLAVGDDVLLNHIFGINDVPRRNTLYLDSPNITLTFLSDCLQKFVECENVDRVISHVEFAHCREQQVPTLRNITLEYEHNIQVEWSAINSKTGRVMEARVSRNGDDDDFCHLTLSVQSE